jgi:soluble lytic murein transglycosylase
MNESSFNPGTHGSFGEIGLMQIKPSTAEWIAAKYKLTYMGANDLEDPVENIKLGSAFLSWLREKYDNHGRLYLSAYNMGPGNVKSALERNIWPKEYASRVMEHYIRYYTELSKPKTVREARVEKSEAPKTSS